MVTTCPTLLLIYTCIVRVTNGIVIIMEVVCLLEINY